MKHNIHQKFNVNAIKTAHRRRNFSKKFLKEIFANIDFRKKICLKIPRIFHIENVICIFAKNLVNFTTFLCTCIIKTSYLEYAQIAQNIESHSLLLSYFAKHSLVTLIDRVRKKRKEILSCLTSTNHISATKA